MTDSNEKIDLDLGDEEQPQVVQGKSKLIYMIGAAVLIFGVGGGAGIFFMGGDDAKATPPTAKLAQPPKLDINKEAYYTVIDKALTVNIEDEQKKGHFVRIGLTAMTRNEEVKDSIEKNRPLIKDELVLLISEYKYEELLSREGKEKLRQEANELIDRVLVENGFKHGVDRLLITDFATQ